MCTTSCAWSCQGPTVGRTVKKYIKMSLRGHLGRSHSLTNSIEQSPSLEANRFSASHKFTHILYKLKLHRLFHNSPPPVPTLSHSNPIHAPFHFLKIHFNIIPSVPGSSMRSLTYEENTKWSYYIQGRVGESVSTIAYFLHVLDSGISTEAP